MEHITETPLESPFTEENALKIAELIVRIKDWQLLNQVKNKEIDAKEVQLDGKVYNRNNIPFEKFRIELDIMHEKVVKIYSDIYAYVCSKCDEKKNLAYRNSFAALFYAQHIGDTLLPQLFAHRENLLKELNKATRRDEDEYKQLCSWIMDYEQHLKKVISELDLDWIAATIDAEEYINNLKTYINSEHNSRYQINTDAINEMFNITESLSNIQGAIFGIAKRAICDITTSVLDK